MCKKNNRSNFQSESDTKHFDVCASCKCIIAQGEITLVIYCICANFGVFHSSLNLFEWNIRNNNIEKPIKIIPNEPKPQ